MSKLVVLSTELRPGSTASVLQPFVAGNAAVGVAAGAAAIEAAAGAGAIGAAAGAAAGSSAGRDISDTVATAVLLLWLLLAWQPAARPSPV